MDVAATNHFRLDRWREVLDQKQASAVLVIGIGQDDDDQQPQVIICCPEDIDPRHLYHLVAWAAQQLEKGVDNQGGGRAAPG